MLAIPRNALKAALFAAAKQDIRYYLNGVLVEVTATGDAYIVSTDGHRLFAGQIGTDAPNGPYRIIIPRATVETVARQKPRFKGDNAVQLLPLPDGRYSLGDTLFTAVDGTFPEWRRVLPTVTPDTRPGYFNWEYILDGQKALQAWFGSTKLRPYFHQYGEQTGVMTGHDSTAQYIIMPLRVSDADKVVPFKPVPFEKAPESNWEQTPQEQTS